MREFLKLQKPISKAEPKMIKQINGGLLVQEIDVKLIDKWSVPTEVAFDSSKEALAYFGIAAAKHTKSNAIVLVQEYKPGQFRVLGMGAGQPNRVDSLRKLAVSKAVENLKNEQPEITNEQIQKIIGECVFVSEAFFPFSDSIDAAHEMGAKFMYNRVDQCAIKKLYQHAINMVLLWHLQVCVTLSIKVIEF